MRFFFHIGEFSEKTSVYGVLSHTKSTWSVQGSLTLCVMKETELRRARGSPGKQGLLLLLLLRDIRQDGNCTSWDGTSLPSHQQLSHQTIHLLNGSDSSQLLFPGKVSSKATGNLSSSTTLGHCLLSLCIEAMETHRDHGPIGEIHTQKPCWCCCTFKACTNEWNGHLSRYMRE